MAQFASIDDLIPDDWAAATDESTLHDRLTAQVEALETVYDRRREHWRRCLSLYLDRAVGEDGLDDLDDEAGDANAWRRKKPNNVVASVVDTVDSHTSEIVVFPWYMSQSGNYGLQTKAKNLTRAFKADFEEYNYGGAINDAVMDALIGDAGVVRMFSLGGRPALERVLPYRVLVAPSEYDRTDPSTYYYVRPMDKRSIQAAFPGAKPDAIDGGRMFSHHDRHGRYRAMVDVVEAVRLPCGPGDKGRRVSFTDAGVLDDSPYEYAFPPYLVIKWRRNPGSYWGIGLAETLAGNQSDIDFKVTKIRENESLVNGKWVFDGGSGISASSLDDLPAIIEKKQGAQMPVWLHPPPVPPDLRQSLATSIESGFASAGVSQMAASAEKPAGLDSGEAQRVHVQITSKRFRKWQLVVQAAYLMVGKMWSEFLLRDASIERSRKVVIQVGRGLRELTYKDLAIDTSKYRVAIKGSAFFATTPAALLQELQEYVRTGQFSPVQAMRIQQTGDLDAELDLATAPEELADARLAALVETGEYLPPEPWFDLQLHVDRGALFYQRCELEGVEQTKLALVRRYITQCIDFQALQAGQYPGQGGGGEAGAEVGPEGPPVGPPPGPEGAAPPPGLMGGAPPGPMQASAQAATAEAQQNAIRQDAMAQIGSLVA